MNASVLLRVLIVIIIIIGGVIIIILGLPQPPEPICLACGANGLKLLGIAEMVLGAAALITANKLTNKVQQTRF